MANCTDGQNKQGTVHVLFVQFLVWSCMFQLLIWHFFVLTQKSTQKKSIQKDASSLILSHSRLFVGPAHLSFRINILHWI